jgi:hypothetical protein
MYKLGSRLRKLFAKKDPTRISDERLEQRVSRVAESILDNERLTADLDDSATKELLDWGLAAAKQIAQGTADVDDDASGQHLGHQRARGRRRRQHTGIGSHFRAGVHPL